MEAANLVIVDGDIVCYRVGFSCQAKVDGVPFIEPEGIALARVDQMLVDIMTNTEAGSMIGYLTDGKDNFRKKVAKTVPYKGNRVLDKPIHYDAIRKHLNDKYGFTMCYTQEADDMIGITHMEYTQGDLSKPCIIASIDKDLLMIPGYHYNIASRESMFILPSDAMHRFFIQILVGDRVDNVVGLKGIGPVKAEKILNGKHGFWDMYNATLAAYLKHHEDPARMHENAELLWVRRYEEPFDWKDAELTYMAYHGGGK